MKTIIKRITETLLRMVIITVCIVIFGIIIEYVTPIIVSIPAPITGAILLAVAFICMYCETKSSAKMIEEHNKIELYKAEIERLQILLSMKDKEKEND